MSNPLDLWIAVLPIEWPTIVIKLLHQRTLCILRCMKHSKAEREKVDLDDSPELIKTST